MSTPNIFGNIRLSQAKSMLAWLKRIYDLICGAIYFFLENYRKRYPYVLLGEKYDANSKETILKFRVVGKRHVVEMSAKQICNMKDIIKNFQPLDVRVISFIAGVEQILNVPEESRENSFEKLKNDIFHKG